MNRHRLFKNLDKFIGDAIMVIGGVLVSFENKEFRVVKATLDMQSLSKS